MSNPAFICGGNEGLCGGAPWVLSRFHCLWCAVERDGIYRLVMGGYGSDRICEWCGTWFSDGQYCERIPEGERNRNREKVAAVKANPNVRRVENVLILAEEQYQRDDELLKEMEERA